MSNANSKVGRLAGNAQNAGLLDFEDVIDLPTKDAKRKQMLMRVKEIYRSAATRLRQSGKGEAFPDPDHNAQVKCVELASRLMNLFSDEQNEQEQREADIQQVAKLFRDMGWKVEPPGKAA